jgi:ABC-type dipeptide/oligopeptide/nickel transport system ATPase component
MTEPAQDSPETPRTTQDAAPETGSNQPLLRVDDLRITFNTANGSTEAVKGISFDLQKGETLAIVGESGSGKSVTCLSLTRLLPQPPAEYPTGKILFNGENILELSSDRLRKIRGSAISYIFQEPSTSLNPVYTVRTQLGEALKLHRPDVKNVEEEIVRWLDRVGIVDPAKRLNDYPHQLSGGMQQRVMIAMALSCHPQILVADEPTTALDVTIQAQIIDQLKELKRELDMSIILITHNFGIIGGLADRVAVMYRGKIVEYGKCETILRDPQHPYTKALLDCIPRLGDRRERLTTIDHDALAKTGSA